MFSLNRDPTGELEYPTKYDAGPHAQGGLCCSQVRELHSILPAGMPLSFQKAFAEGSSFPCISRLPRVEFASLALSCPCQLRALV